ncbi:hypothetical protein AGABI2DRAFT_121738 [Agaricus bisporus var. bisporus H97]|uniref:hypothetical protein n=1 Tax=Agaricus bisporus var. bisporus (strain H97 / ATCC MYA-4626 / FGSC 10389) TaxID=936046 RepID=UPI00029F7A5C|nr:hypothetical protein AGABI2DRAFT_121738 [Agaricus bisporus var. bisporus H97]EKV43595.1 hypothetical protein AGABI2DRAFT_121738 [Agaricus bisporus var. bisporus H97]
MPNDAPTSAASLPALLPETDHARVDLDDNVANFYHRLDRLKQKQTTKTSVLNALTAIVPVCESMLQRLAIDPAALEHPSIFQLLRRGRRCFEIWQNDHDNSYRMPPVHNRIKSTLAQKSRTQATSNQNADAAADTDAAPATPVIPAKVPMDPVHAEVVPPKKKRRRGKLPKSAETVASSDEEGENAEEVVICNHNPEERVLTLPENSAAMQVDNEGGPVEATVTTDTTPTTESRTRSNSCSAMPKAARAHTVRIPYAHVPGLDTNSWAYKRAVQILSGLGSSATGTPVIQAGTSMVSYLQGLSLRAVELDHAQASAANIGLLAYRTLATTQRSLTSYHYLPLLEVSVLVV